ncbi:HEAT repeat domain-containing protein [Candidatus Manganitrophus noduliformans]|uniref:HEAT repeat domain-containing protein n=1 Tax=Candidatus Manganitrophus noduliformans TaxID=2606439 RepID=A0A7X6DQD0_9BACT|nr:HEAT repeat domain-containing protein [Candidatus Manganitrophus noduliformans]NKE71387.1 HEAT repeat domain-containing protein [Candidatus Manganitrophus noduliformans]
MRSSRVISLSIGLALLLTQGGFAFDEGPSKTETVSSLFKPENKNIDPIIFEELSRLAKDPDPYVRLEAVNQLNTWYEDPKVAEVLRAAAHDDIWIVRRAPFPYGTPRDLLLDDMVDEDVGIRDSAVFQAARPNDSRFVDAFLDRLYDPYSKIVYDSLIALGESNDKRAIKPILEFLLSHPEWESSVKISIKLLTGEPLEKVMEAYRSELKPAPKNKVTFKQREAAPQIKLLQEGNRIERVSAALRLAWADKPEALNALIWALKDNDSTVRAAAAQSLGAWPLMGRWTEKVLHALMESAIDSDSMVREISMVGVGQFTYGEYSAPAIEFLEKAVQNEKDPSVRAAAVYSLGGVNTTRSSKILLGFLNDPSAEVREHAVRGVNLECLPSGLEHVIKALYDPNPSVRRFAAFSVGRPKDRVAVQPLIDVLMDSDEMVRFGAVSSLGFIGAPEAIQKMKEVAEADPSEEVRERAREAIQNIENQPAEESKYPIVNWLFKLISKLKPLPEHCKG